MKILRVLLVDDDPKFLAFAGDVLNRAKYSVIPFADLESAGKALDETKGRTVILSELNVRNRPALGFLQDTLRKYPQVPFTLLANSPSLESVIDALRLGAYDFLRKPVAPDILCHSVARSVEKLNLHLDGERQEEENRKLLAKSRGDLEKVKKISDFKGFLISTTAHDFNSTLTVLDGYHQFIRRNCKSCEETGMGNLLDQAHRSITRLRMMVGTLMDYEAAEKGELRLQFRSFDLPGLLEECISFYRPYAEQKEILMGLEEELQPLTARGDPARVMQVMDNLLYNAVKFTPPGGRIDVGAKASDKSTAVVWVRDTGVGISKKIQDRIFETDGNKADREGNGRIGIGLSICKRLVEVQNGKIWLESRPGKGTIVTFSLPM